MTSQPNWLNNGNGMCAAIKTNVMRILDARRVPYMHYEYDASKFTDGASIASHLGQDARRVFKTLVCTTPSNKIFVFMIPVCNELDLKRAAAACNEKSLSMLHQRDLLPLTGYVHGGCSPIGMKKQFITIADASVLEFETVIFSAGRIGHQVEISPGDLGRIIPLKFADICA